MATQISHGKWMENVQVSVKEKGKVCIAEGFRAFIACPFKESNILAMVNLFQL